MSKYSRNFKCEVARRYENTSSTCLSQEYGVSARQIRYWSLAYHLNGNSAFLHRGKPYSQDFKIKVIEQMETEQWSLSYASAFFDLSSPGILSAWLSHYNRGGLNSLNPRDKGKMKVKTLPNSSSNKKVTEMSDKELREELEYLRAENAVLKKLKALAQEERIRTIKRR